MLSKEEEYRLAAFLGVLRRDIKEGFTQDPDIELKNYLWLAEKLKETNDELKKLRELMDKAEVADVIEKLTSSLYHNPKNDISDRWYSR